MGERIAYFRVSTTGQSIESQRAALGGGFVKEFTDEGVSGAMPAAQRPGFASLLQYVREGDEVHVYAVDRLGRDALDVQATVRSLIDAGVTVYVLGLGAIGRGVGELILAVLAQVADMERGRIVDRCSAGRELARQELAATGKTHRGKSSLGRPRKASAEEVRAWRQQHGASLTATAAHFGMGVSTAKRYLAERG